MSSIEDPALAVRAAAAAVPATSLPPARSKVALIAGAIAATGLMRAAEYLMPAPMAMMMRLTGSWQTQLLHVAARLEIADRVAAGPKSTVELAAESGSDPDALHRALRALATVGVFTMDSEGRVRNNRLSETLRRGGVASMRDPACYFGSPASAQAWGDLETTVRTGRPSFPRVHGASLWSWLAARADEGDAFAGTMTSFTEQDAPSIAASFDFGRFEKVCDVAGGRGTLLAEILVQHRRPRGLLFDQKDVLDRAVPYLASRGIEGRIELEPGSFFDRVPSGCDAYVLKDILHDWDDARCKAILDQVSFAMKPGATLLVSEILVEKNSTLLPGPLIDIHMMTICDAGRQRSEGEMATLLAGSGLALRKVHPTKTAIAIVEAQRA
ncbi:MAG TPA: methyltransferase [Polyangiaceae bacterium]|jgi:hypothetical protein